MKKLLLSLSILTLFFFVVLPIDDAEARRGCCSWHGGVCSYQCPGGGTGYRCCDGTSLSAKCAPYYPSCYTKPAPKYEPPISKYEPPAPKESSPAPEKFTAEVSKEGNGGSIWWWIIGIGAVGYLCYALGKRKK